MTRPTVGFIGLGVMGRPMAANLVKAGYRLVVHRDSEAARAALPEAQFVPSAAEVAARATVIVLMLPDTPDVEAVAAELVPALQPGSLIIDMSSISPTATRALAATVAAAGSSWLDAPVSGGELGARNATLSIMVGGAAPDLERATPLLEAMGSRIVHIGDVGSGQVAKVANQILVGATIEAVAEAFALVRAFGADLEATREALLGGFAASKVLEVHGERMIAGTFEPGFRLRLHRKDLRLAVDASAELDLDLPLTAATQQVMNGAVGTGLGDADHSALYRLRTRD
ncbi:NAD(P)-dependent oxidoreductase [Nonomuraea jabiensis]|uniref:NAD(P)-dependent oxidoreductase n=1 Tax=Nonomuraea jabiensis TaxID=882448 RepID=UPI00341F1068